MARNRRTQSAAIRFGPAIKAFLLCLVIGGSGVGYVWQKSQIEELGRQIRKNEMEVRGLQVQNEKLRKQLAMMYSPRYLEAKVKELSLGLVQADPSQKWLLREAPSGISPSARSRDYAAQ
ncbi:MAG TPA: hypothetical protein VIV82_10320 [Verrucomicrobiae bacterium]